MHILHIYKYGPERKLGKIHLHKKQKYSEKILGGVRLGLISFTGPIFVFTGPIFDLTGPFLTEQAHFHALQPRFVAFRLSSLSHRPNYRVAGKILHAKESREKVGLTTYGPGQKSQI